MAIELREVEHLAALARIAVSNEEKKILQHDLEEILAYVSQVKEADEERGEQREQGGTKKQAELHNIMRDDRNPHAPGLFIEALLSAAPSREENRVLVKKIL